MCDRPMSLYIVQKGIIGIRFERYVKKEAIMGAIHMIDFERKKFNFWTSSFSSLESFSWFSYRSFSHLTGFTPKTAGFIIFILFKQNVREDISSFWSRIFRRFLWRFNVWIRFSYIRSIIYINITKLYEKFRKQPLRLISSSS